MSEKTLTKLDGTGLPELPHLTLPLPVSNQTLYGIMVNVIKYASIVAETMGPKGRKVLISEGGKVYFTRDGVTVCKKLTSSVPEGMDANAVRLLYDASTQVVSKVGDGTTTVCVLVRGALKAIAKSTQEFHEIPEKIKEQVFFAKTKIKELAKDATKDSLVNVAVAAANNNVVLGKMIAELIFGLGKDSYVIAKQSRTIDTHVDIQKGYAYKGGAYIENFLAGKASMILHNPYLLFLDEKVLSYKTMVPVYNAYREAVKKGGAGPLVIVATDIDGEVLRFILANASRESDPIPVYVVKSPYLNEVDKRITTLLDLKLVSGAATIFSPYEGARIANFQKYGATAFGRAESIHFSESETRIVHGFESRIKAESLISDIEKEIETTEDPERILLLKERLSKLSSGVGIVYLGGATQAEQSYVADVVEDCVRACQAAMQGGVVPGAGYTADFIADALDREYTESQSILATALRDIRYQIMLNAKMQYTHFVPGQTFNVQSGKWIEVESTDVYDPAAVLSTSIDAAMSLFSEIIQTQEYVIQL